MVGAIVRARIPAADAEQAMQLLCERIRVGIGPDSEQPREWELAIAAGTGRAEQESLAAQARVNESFLRDLARETGKTETAD